MNLLVSSPFLIFVLLPFVLYHRPTMVQALLIQSSPQTLRAAPSSILSGFFVIASYRSTWDLIGVVYHSFGGCVFVVVFGCLSRDRRIFFAPRIVLRYVLFPFFFFFELMETQATLLWIQKYLFAPFMILYLVRSASGSLSPPH